MPQKDAWEKEYKNPKLITLGDDPQKDVRRFLKFLRREEKVTLENLDILDLGSGTGKNANYLASLGNRVMGIEIAPTAVALAKERAKEMHAEVKYHQGSIGEAFPLEDHCCDVVMDVMTSNSLNERERDMYLKETHRVLRPGGHFFYRGLCKDGDENAKTLLKTSPGPEYDTYLNAEMNLVERVFSEKDFVALYSPFFTILSLTKKTNYARFNGRIYKRNYWIAYMRREAHT